MADRDRDYYRSLFPDSEQISEDDIDKMIAFIATLGDRTEDDGELEDDYETMDPDDFLMKALGEGGGDDDDDDEDDDDEDADSVGGNANEDKPDEGLPSDEGIKDTEEPAPKKRGRPRKKDTGCVSDATVKNLAAALRDLRF